MANVEHRKTLTAAPDKVWALIVDTGTWSEWFSVHEKWVEEPPATLSAGVKLVDKFVMLGMANKFDWTVAEFEAPTRLKFDISGMAGVKAVFTFKVTGVGEGTEVAVECEFEGAILKGALAKATEKDARTQIEKSLDALDKLAVAG